MVYKMKGEKSMKEVTKKMKVNQVQGSAAKLGGLVCNKNAPALKPAKLGGLVCNKNAPSVRA